MSSAQLTGTPDAFIDPFERTVNESKEDFLAAEVPSANILTKELETAFENLMNSLTEALAPTVAENPEEGNTTVDTTMDEDAPVPDLIAGLKAAFSSAIDDLTKELSGVANALPELSEPHRSDRLGTVRDFPSRKEVGHVGQPLDFLEAGGRDRTVDPR